MNTNVRTLLENYEDGGIAGAEGFFKETLSKEALFVPPRFYLEMAKLYYLSGRADKADSLLQKLSSIPKQLQGGGPEAAEASAWKAELDRYARYRTCCRDSAGKPLPALDVSNMATPVTHDLLPFLNLEGLSTLEGQTHAADVQQELAQRYESGTGGAERNLPSAIFWYGKVAEQGYEKARDTQKRLSELLKEEQQKLAKELAKETMEKQFRQAKEAEEKYCFTKAFGLYREAAEAGHAGAQCRLAFYYENGWETAANRQTAIKWYRAAAEQGLPEAQDALNRLGAN